MTVLGFLVFFFVVCHVSYVLRKDYAKGLAWCMFYLVCLPHRMRIETAGIIPELTIHRAIILMALIMRVGQHLPPILFKKIPFYPLIVALLISYGGSVFCSDFPGDSIKGWFAVIFENVIIYFLLIASLTSLEDGKRCVIAVGWGIALAAAIAIPEYYMGINLITLLVPDHAVAVSGAAVGCYEHEILNGYIMAMTVPLLMALSGTASVAGHRWMWRMLLLLVMAACYCAQKRGPWLGGILGAVTLAALATKEIRREMLWLSALVVVLMITMPGVRETVYDKLNSVFIHDGEQEASAEYRRILWRVAWDKITETPGRLLFGLGGMATSHLDISGYFDKGRGGQVMGQGFSSWDSQWAANLVQFGLVGFGLEIALRVAVLMAVFSRWRAARHPDEKALAAAVCCVVLVYMWAMLTVAIFSPQLKYMLWAVTAVGLLPLYRAENINMPDKAVDEEVVNDVQT